MKERTTPWKVAGRRNQGNQNRGGETKHTPTPWKVSEPKVYMGITQVWIVQGDAQLVRIEGSKREEVLHRAAFIVRAVNAHQALLSFARIFLKGECDQEVMESIAEKAIAKAEAV